MNFGIQFDPAARRFRVDFPGLSGTMPALEGAALRAWTMRYSYVGRHLADELSPATRTNFEFLGPHREALSGLVDVLVAYDVDRALGGRETIEQTLDAVQLQMILDAIRAAHR